MLNYYYLQPGIFSWIKDHTLTYLLDTYAYGHGHFNSYKADLSFSLSFSPSNYHPAAFLSQTGVILLSSSFSHPLHAITHPGPDDSVS